MKADHTENFNVPDNQSRIPDSHSATAKNSFTAPDSTEAYAKLNLSLDILRRRPDGFHDLYMVMQTVSLADRVSVAEQRDITAQSGKFTLRTDRDFIPPGQTTLEERAVQAFFSAIGQPAPSLCVTLEKKIPAYAGMGGGSSDVAALLRLLRKRYAPELSDDTLERVGLTVGSDVPFCIRGGTALAQGRGERLTDLPSLPDCWFVLCKPDFGISTPMLFARADESFLQFRPDVDAMVNALRRGSLPDVAQLLGNVFETVLPEEYSAQIQEIKRRMKKFGAWNAAMSGSGPTVFGIYPDSAQALAAVEHLRHDYRETFTARPVKRYGSPRL